MPIPVPKSASPEVQSAPYKVGSTDSTYGDFRDQLFNDGWAVVPGVIPAENAESYVSSAYDWLESFNLGFDRNDKSTHVASNLPFSYKGGLYSYYGSGHEAYAWDIRQEPGIIDAFAKIWGTDELLCSYDAVNLSVPLAKTEGNAEIFKPWPHVDQSPTRQFLHCIQGIANLAPNGPDDGGLMVLRGSKEHYIECFTKFAHLEPKEGWTLEDNYVHDEAMIEWLVNEKGCTWHKVTAPAGSLILWDSRTVHYGAPPTGNNARMATYVCYKPANLITAEQLAVKQAAFHNQQNTSHDPIVFRTKPNFEPAPNDAGWKVRHAPDKKAVLSERGLQLAGIVPY